MTSADVTELRYWLDLAIKAIIGVVVSIVGLDYKNLKSSLHDLEQTKYTLTAQVQVLQTEVNGVKERLDRIEKKLDRALDR
jgi:hypothetical protein